MSTQDFDQLGSPATGVFESALRSVTKALSQAEAVRRPGLFKLALDSLCIPELPARERDRRIRLLIEEASLSDKDIIAVSGRIDLKALGILNVLLSLLPPEARQALVRPPLIVEPSLVPFIDSSSTKTHSPDHEYSSAIEVAKPSAFRTVVLLGTESEHERNSSVLKENSFLPLPVRRMAEQSLEQLLTDEVCGLIVAGSFWEGKSARQQEEDLHRICGITSLLFIRIDEGPLHASAGLVLAKIHEGALGASRGSDLCRGHGCDITHSDLVVIGRIADLLCASEGIQLFSSELGEGESRLLRIAAAKLVKGRWHGKALKRLGVSFLSGGKSGAKVAVLKPDDGGLPLVVKMHDVKMLREEVARHGLYIRRWESRVNPELSFHGGCSLLMYNLIESPGAPGTPAPTLEDHLEKFLLSELGWDPNALSEQQLYLILQRSVDRLTDLNKQQAGSYGTTDLPVYDASWLLSSLKNLSERGVAWSLTSEPGAPNLFARASGWLKRVEGLDGLAVCHNDVHSRNILVSDFTPIFIDYSMSGHGHPCYDLVRLNAVVLYRLFRNLDGEDVASELFRCIVAEGADFDAVERRFPSLASSSANRLALRLTICIRKACLDILETYNGVAEDYFAMQGLVGCYSLTNTLYQHGTVRGMLRALT